MNDGVSAKRSIAGRSRNRPLHCQHRSVDPRPDGLWSERMLLPKVIGCTWPNAERWVRRAQLRTVCKRAVMWLINFVTGADNGSPPVALLSAPLQVLLCIPH